MNTGGGASPGDLHGAGWRASVVRLCSSDGADPEAVFDAVVSEMGGDAVTATYADGLTIDVVCLDGDQVARLLKAARAVDPLIHASQGGPS